MSLPEVADAQGPNPAYLADGLVFPEGPRWHGGRLWFSDMLDKRIFTLTEEGTLQKFAGFSGWSSGLGWDNSGHLLAVSMLDRTLLRLEDGRWRVYASLSHLSPHPFNDMIVSSSGRAYVGNMGYAPFTGEVMQPSFVAMVNPDGSSCVVAEGLCLPNGMALTAGGELLLLAETFAHRLLAFVVRRDGTLGPPDLFADLGSSAPDGICLDTHAGVWVALPLQRAVIRIGADGVRTHQIDMPGRTPVSCAVGGKRGSTLYICSCRVFKERGMMTVEEAREARPGYIEAFEIDPSGLERWRLK
jgi:sugar lactone lactonase YvrE